MSRMMMTAARESKKRCMGEAFRAKYFDKLTSCHEEIIFDDAIENGLLRKIVRKRLYNNKPLLCHEFLNRRIFRLKQQTYLVHKLHRDPNVSLSFVKAILSVPGFNPNKGDSYGETPLMTAIINNRHDILKVFLAHPQVDVNKPTLFRRNSELALPAIPVSPLMVAVRTLNLEAVKLLLERKDIDVNWKNMAGQTALTIAYQKTIDVFYPDEYNHDDELTIEEHNAQKKIEFEKIQAGAKALMELLEAHPGIHGPLHYRNTFSLDHHKPAPAFVGNYGGDLYTHGHELFKAVLKGMKKRVSSLLALETIDVNYDHVLPQKKGHESGASESGFLPVHAFLKNNLSHSYFGMSPLTVAVENRNYHALTQLLAHPRLDVNRSDFFLYYAYFAENVAPVFDHKNALLIAAINNDAKAFDLLLEHKDIDVNKLSSWGRTTVFMECVERGHTKLAEKLLARPELDLNVRNTKEEDALCLASKKGNLTLVEGLVGDPRQKKGLSNKALRFAHTGQHLDICLRILEWLYPTPTMLHRAKKIGFLKRKEGLPSVYEIYDDYITVKFAQKIDLRRDVVAAVSEYINYSRNLENRIKEFLEIEPGLTQWQINNVLKRFRLLKSLGIKQSVDELSELRGVNWVHARFLCDALHGRFEKMEKQFALSSGKYTSVERRHPYCTRSVASVISENNPVENFLRRYEPSVLDSEESMTRWSRRTSFDSQEKDGNSTDASDSAESCPSVSIW